MIETTLTMMIQLKFKLETFLQKGILVENSNTSKQKQENIYFQKKLKTARTKLIFQI